MQNKRKEIIFLSKDNKMLIKYLGLILISVLLLYKIPHDSYSVNQYIIRPIRYNNVVIYLSGIVPLAFFIYGVNGLSKLKRFANKSKVLIFIVVAIIIFPFVSWTLDFTRTAYHWIKSDGLQTVDNELASINFQFMLRPQRKFT